jgi:transcriptional regulator with XRE-family HTH domain
MTQEAAAEALQVNPAAYRKYELGRNAPGAGVLAQACLKGVNLNWLLTGQHHMLLRDEDEQYSTNNDLIDQLSASLARLRAVDEEKFLLLCRGFLLRSDEAGEHSILRMNTGPVTLFGEEGEASD